MLYIFGFLLTLVVTAYAPWSWASSAPQVFFFGVTAGAVLAFFGLPLAFSLSDPPTPVLVPDPQALESGKGRGVLAAVKPRTVTISNPSDLEALWREIGPLGPGAENYRHFLVIRWAYRMTGADPLTHTVGVELGNSRYVVISITPDPIPENP